MTYKPDLDDVRTSPAVEIKCSLTELGADVGYVDTHVPELRIDHRVLVSTDAPLPGAWDLILIHTLHSGVSTAWIADHPRLLDATYQLPPGTRRAVP